MPHPPSTFSQERRGYIKSIIKLSPSLLGEGFRERQKRKGKVNNLIID
jgi:hypothetical protein